MIVLKNISVNFDEKTVLKNFSATFEDGKKYAIMGQSGIGKTTILNVISGLVKTHGGTVKNTSGNKISYIFQEPRLFDWLNVTKNVSIVSPLPTPQNRPDIQIRPPPGCKGGHQKAVKQHVDVYRDQRLPTKHHGQCHDQQSKQVDVGQHRHNDLGSKHKRTKHRAQHHFKQVL